MEKNVTDYTVISTKKGDKGTSADYSGNILPKYDLFFETVGTLDELNSWLGLVKNKVPAMREAVDSIQDIIIHICSLIATGPEDPRYHTLAPVTENDVEKIEAAEQVTLKNVVIERKFVHPGKTETAAYCDIARTICRRAERRMVEYIRSKNRTDLEYPMKFVNRLSDLLFIIARSQD